MDDESRLGEAVTTARQAWERARDVDAILAAAGVAFFALLSAIPAMGALVAVYGLFADPSDITRQVSDFFGDDYGPGREWVVGQLERLTATSSSSLTFAAIIAIVLALWSASSGVRHLFDAVDLAFGRQRAPFVWARARGLLGMLGLVVVAAVVIGLLAVAPDLPGWLSWVRYPLIVAIVLFGCALLYRPGGATGPAPAGAVVATGIWVVGTVGLGIYVGMGPNLQDAYGAFASVVVVMLWLWVCGIALLAGAHVTATLHGGPPPRGVGSAGSAPELGQQAQ